MSYRLSEKQLTYPPFNKCDNNITTITYAINDKIKTMIVFHVMWVISLRKSFLFLSSHSIVVRTAHGQGPFGYWPVRGLRALYRTSSPCRAPRALAFAF